MGKIYRVAVTEDVSGATLFELAGPAAMLSRLVPDALSDALDSIEDEYASKVSAAAGVLDEDDDGPDAPTTPDGPRPRRARRTKAQMAADAATAAAPSAPPATADTATAPYNPFATA